MPTRAVLIDFPPARIWLLVPIPPQLIIAVVLIIPIEVSIPLGYLCRASRATRNKDCQLPVQPGAEGLRRDIDNPSEACAYTVSVSHQVCYFVEYPRISYLGDIYGILFLSPFEFQNPFLSGPHDLDRRALPAARHSLCGPFGASKVAGLL